MRKHRLIAFTLPLCLSLTIALSACQTSTESTTDSTEATAGSAANSVFSALQYSLAPGASRSIVSLDATKLKKVSFVSSQPEIAVMDATGAVKVSAAAVIGSKTTITASYKGSSTNCIITVKYSLLDTVTTNAKGKKVVTDPEDIAVVVNKQRSLPDTYIPTDLVEPQIPFTFKAIVEKRMLRSVAASALEKLVAGAEADDIHLFGVSGYRSFATQRTVFGGNVQDKGEVEANKVSAVPGQSEHQTGLAIDLTNNVPEDQLEESFGESKEGIWLAAHAAEYGFIIRYLKGMESITGYVYEPWHIRYVGQDIAQDVSARKITLEQYFDDAIAVQAPN